MTVNCSEQELGQIWSNFGLEHLFYLLLEHGAKARQTNFYKFWAAYQLSTRGTLVYKKHTLT
jgi:hypothetical protein